MGKIIIALIVLVALVGGGYYFFMQDPDTSDLTPPTSGFQDTTDNETNNEPDGAVADPAFDALIAYTDSGYSPATVTIKKGQTVRFVNNSSNQETWPASAVHPTHGVYPEKTAADCLGSAFDACRGLKSGEFWEFTFNQTGTWRFHDHLHASKTGSVVVTE